MLSDERPHHPQPWVLALVAEIAQDPVISLARRDAPTHALVRTIYAGCGDEAIVEVDLIDSPPPPTAPTYGGFFETIAYDAPGVAPERAWFVFDRTLNLVQNIARLRNAARDCVFHTGRRESAPVCVDDVPEPVEAARPSFDDMGRTQQQRASQPPPSGKALPTPARAGSPSSQRVGPSSHRVPPRRRAGPPEPPPPAPPLPPEPRAPFSAPPPSQPPQPAPPSPAAQARKPPPPPRRSSVPPPPQRSSAPMPGAQPFPPPPPVPVPTGEMMPHPPPSSGPTSGLPPPPPPPPPPPFGEEGV